ncbi:hydroxymethylglutaryl-CoA synthase [Uncinocarpus reesii 1704]|uniref:Hydroxymethylglutaryl-CoA synthase n=1 Tax=Uncinocarpus reesii (strain UAMH 1704) TaxID=336963 RepID=C4JYZ9_UNCRE|nr:hydroxymethylglutaryl-CoA synthase [Uncinocarpus reesii 1704]EEP82535.1 hydroxymethylglutaryl-CoA synthase [Uncinocarpus reesii 1704]
MSSRPQNIGIKALEVYFPSQCVDQAELEKFDGVSQGKYTIGLGQTKMSFCDDREDIYSMALTTLSSLLRKYNIDPTSIGRLEVGTETILDKSKSVKSVLMQLFAPAGNTNVEGVDTVNACYGGTNALFNSINWVESSAWDGRDAIVVTGDIALYKKGNARPTGGAGCVAMLIGPNAPMVIESGLRGSYITHAYDFYKPDLTSEYPYVDGHFSIKCYTQAVDACYKAYNAREKALSPAQNGEISTDESKTPLDRFDHILFHAPTCKLVSKSYGRLLYNDYLANPSHPAFAEVPAEILDLDYDKSLSDKTVEKTFMALTKKRFAEKVQPSIQVATLCGNMYCASVYGGLVSLLSNVAFDATKPKRVGVFSYGSGLASSMFSLKIVGDVSNIVEKLDLQKRLDARRVVSPQVFDDMCLLREKAHLKKDFTSYWQPRGPIPRNLLPYQSR